MRGERHSDSLQLRAGLSCVINNGMTRVMCQIAQVLPCESPSMRTDTACRKLDRVTETTNMGSLMVLYKPEANTSNFFKQAYEHREVLILRPDSWLQKSRSITTPRRGEVLAILLVTNQRPRPCKMFCNTVIFTLRSC